MIFDEAIKIMSFCLWENMNVEDNMAIADLYCLESALSQIILK